jgi:hypothetical protein
MERTVEARVHDLEMAHRRIDRDLYLGDAVTHRPGLVQHYWENQAEKRGEQKFWRGFAIAVGILQAVMACALTAQKLGWIK